MAPPAPAAYSLENYMAEVVMSETPGSGWQGQRAEAICPSVNFDFFMRAILLP